MLKKSQSDPHPAQIQGVEAFNRQLLPVNSLKDIPSCPYKRLVRNLQTSWSLSDPLECRAVIARAVSWLCVFEGLFRYFLSDTNSLSPQKAKIAWYVFAALYILLEINVHRLESQAIPVLSHGTATASGDNLWLCSMEEAMYFKSVEDASRAMLLSLSSTSTVLCNGSRIFKKHFRTYIEKALEKVTTYYYAVWWCL